MIGGLAAIVLGGLLVGPLVAMAWSTSSADVFAAMGHPDFAPAVALSLRTSVMSLGLTLILGTPLAWWLSRSRSPVKRVTSILVQLPIVVPPAVMGIALLQTFGRQGLLGPALAGAGIQIPFTETAVVLAQTVVAAPFYVQAAAVAFRKVDVDLVLVARSLGESRRGAFFRVALPVALPGLLTGASLAWARAIGEFGATLLFAGSLRGTTQTMPLAIFSALESDVRLAVVLALVLAALGGGLLALLRAVPMRRV